MFGVINLATLILVVVLIFVGVPFLVLSCFKLGAYGYYKGKFLAQQETSKKESPINGNSNGKKRTT